MSIFDQYIEAARVAAQEDEKRLVAARERHQAELVEQAEAFIQEHDLGELLAALDLAEEPDFPDRAHYPQIRYGLRFEDDKIALGGWLEFWGNSTVKITFDHLLALYLPASDVRYGELLINLMNEAQNQYAHAVSTAQFRISQAPDVNMLETMYAEELRVFPQEAAALTSVYEQALAELEQRRQERLAEEAARAEAEAARKEMEAGRARIQAEVWWPFVVYRVEYGIVARDEDGDALDFADTASVFSLQAEPAGDGWWPLVHQWSGERLAPRRFAHVVSVERLEIRNPGPGNFCTERDGVYYPPEGAEHASE